MKKNTLPPWYKNTYVPDIFKATKSLKNAPLSLKKKKLFLIIIPVISCAEALCEYGLGSLMAAKGSVRIQWYPQLQCLSALK